MSFPVYKKTEISVLILSTLHGLTHRRFDSSDIFFSIVTEFHGAEFTGKPVTLSGNNLFFYNAKPAA